MIIYLTIFLKLENIPETYVTESIKLFLALPYAKNKFFSSRLLKAI